MAKLTDSTNLNGTITVSKATGTKVTLDTDKKYLDKDIELNINVSAGGVTQNAPTVNSSTGLVTATSTVGAGYVESGTKSNTLQLSTQAETVHHVASAYKTDSISAAVKTVTDAVEDMPIEMKVSIEPQQYLHGYDHPWPAGGGKNLAKGFTLDELKSRNTAGTWSGNSYTDPAGITFSFEFDNMGLATKVKVNGTATSISQMVAHTIEAKSGTGYILNGCPSGGSSSKYELMFATNVAKAHDYGAGVTYTPDSDYTLNLNVTIRSGQTVSNLEFAPMARLSSEADTTWKPYQNICPITGWTMANITNDGVNLCDNSQNTIGYYNANGDYYNDSSFRTSALIAVKSSTKYHTNLCTQNGKVISKLYSTLWDSNGNFITEISDEVFTTTAATAYVRVRAHSRYSTTVNSNDYIYQITEEKEYNIPFPTSAGTVYGGQLTLLKDGSGELVVDTGIYTFTGQEEIAYSSNTQTFYTISVVAQGMEAKSYGNAFNGISNKFKPFPGNVADAWKYLTDACVGYGSANGSGNVGAIRFSIPGKTSVDSDVTSIIAGTQVVYKLATPKTYSLTASQVKTLLGTNNIWADTGNIIQLTYAASTPDDILAAGKYTIGKQSIDPIVAPNLLPQNVKAGTTITVGDTSDTDSIESVTGTFTGASTVSNGQTAAASAQILPGYSAFVDGAEVQGNISTQAATTYSIDSADNTVNTAADVMHITDGVEGLPVQIKVGIEPQQDLHGYDYPWPAGGGKNLLNTTELESGTFNGDGINVSNSAVVRTGYIPVKASTTYMPSCESGKYPRAIHFYNSSKESTSVNITTFPVTTNNTTAFMRVAFKKDNGETFNPSELTNAQLEEGSTATSFAPYSNICPISGWTEANVTRTGKNLFNKDAKDANNGYLLNAYFSSASGGFTNGATEWQVSEYIPIEETTAYTMSWPEANGGNVYSCFYDSDKNFLSTVKHSLNLVISFTPPTNARYIRISNKKALEGSIQLEKSSSATTYETFGNIYPITFPSSAGTVYGGTLTVNKDGSGTLMVDKKKKVYTGDQSEEWGLHSSIASWFYINGSADNAYLNNNEDDYCISNKYVQYQYSDVSHLPNGKFCLGAKSNTNRLVIIDTNYTTVEQLKTALASSNLEIVYKLATPVTYSLTAPQVRTLLGVNNIWSSTGQIKQLIYSSTTPQTLLAAEKYTTGIQSANRIVTDNLYAQNIKYGINARVGDAADNDKYADVTGTFTGADTVSSGQVAATADKMLSGYSAFVDGQEVKGSIGSGTVVASVSSNTGGSASMAATGFTASNSVTSYYVTLSTTAGSVKAKAQGSTAGYITTSTSNETAATSVAVSGNGNKLYIPVAAPTFKGGAVSGTATASSSTGASLSTSTNSSGVTVVAAASATRAKVQYNAAVEGYLSKTASEDAYDAGSATALTSTTYYLNGVTLTAPTSGERTFIINTPAGNFKFHVDSSNNVAVTEA